MRKLATKEKRNMSADDLRRQKTLVDPRNSDFLFPEEETPTQGAGGTSNAHTHEQSEVRL